MFVSPKLILLRLWSFCHIGRWRLHGLYLSGISGWYFYNTWTRQKHTMHLRYGKLDDLWNFCSTWHRAGKDITIILLRNLIFPREIWTVFHSQSTAKNIILLWMLLTKFFAFQLFYFPGSILKKILWNVFKIFVWAHKLE